MAHDSKACQDPPSTGTATSKPYRAVIPFVQKFFDLANSTDFPEIYGFNQEGTSFQIYDAHSFEEHILRRFFNHSNFTSLVRQLNQHDFHKNRASKENIEFFHPYFRRGRPDLLHLIERKPVGSTRKLPPDDDSGDSRKRCVRARAGITISSDSVGSISSCMSTTDTDLRVQALEKENRKLKAQIHDLSSFLHQSDGFRARAEANAHAYAAQVDRLSSALMVERSKCMQLDRNVSEIVGYTQSWPRPVNFYHESDRRSCHEPQRVEGTSRQLQRKEM